ncbi:glucose 1-dehydrogenase [Paenibacillus sp. IB182496]|uniref:Glucose 1-dehydrogenase n=1 Tax=Paenibacillus sabuli TaxID=2772509 RepID=A0A927BW58_9BACL|nr:glucose 1-dehydrogenase [Paenibacillus sabuli]
MEDLSGKTAIVIGGAAGIGLGAARRLAAGGASVLIGDLQREAGEAAAAELRAAGCKTEYRETDVRSASQLEALAEAAERTCGGIDILVNSAGIQRYGDVTETDEALWDEVMAVNAKGVFLASRAVIPAMRRRGGGSIVNVSSVQALASQTRVAAYSASKGAINALTRAMAVDHAAEGIRVNAVCPASIDTPMLREAAELHGGEAGREALLAAWGAMHPIGRLGTPEDIAELIAFLAGDRSGFVTGAELRIDGGMLAALGVRLPEKGEGQR